MSLQLPKHSTPKQSASSLLQLKSYEVRAAASAALPSNVAMPRTKQVTQRSPHTVVASLVSTEVARWMLSLLNRLSIRLSEATCHDGEFPGLRTTHDRKSFRSLRPHYLNQPIFSPRWSQPHPIPSWVTLKTRFLTMSCSCCVLDSTCPEFWQHSSSSHSK